MRRYLQGINGTPVMIFNGEAGDVSARLLKKGVDWNECIRYGEGIGAQLVYPRHPVEVQVDEITVTEIAHRIDYKPGENEYLLRQKERLKKELEGLHPESRRYQMITSCYLYDIEEKLRHDRLTYEGECYIYDFGGFRIVTVPCEIDTVLGKKIREKDEKLTILNAYSNGFLYYAVNEKEYGEVFESYVTYFPYGDADQMVGDILRQYK